MEKDQQIEVLRDGNLEMRTNIHDLLEIVEVQKNRRTVSAKSFYVLITQSFENA